MSKSSFLGQETLAAKMQKIKNEMVVQEIESIANSSEEKVNKKSKITNQSEKQKVTPKLFVNGRLDRKKHTYVAKSLILLTHLEEEIKLYCRGGDLAILNYLIKEGLEKVKTSVLSINVDIEEIERNIV